MAEDENRIDTGGGAFADGDVNTGGGEFTGRDKSIGGDEVHGDSHVGDTVNMSGNFAGAIVNVKATLTDVTQQIQQIPRAEEREKAKLTRLVARLRDAVAQVPPEKQEEAEAVARLTQNLVEAASNENPNQTMMQISGEGLQAAARKLAPTVPTVPEITAKIVALVTALTA